MQAPLKKPDFRRRAATPALLAVAALSMVGCMSPSPQVVDVAPSYSYLTAAQIDTNAIVLTSSRQPWPVLDDQQAYVDGVAETLALDLPALSSQ